MTWWNADSAALAGVLNASSLVFITVYALIALRNAKRGLGVPVWVIMFGGAVAAIFLGGITLGEAYAAINLDVLFFLIGMFSIVSALEISGVLRYVTLWILSLAKTPEKALLFILVGLGTLSAFLMNDTIALMATPIVIDLAREMGVNPVPFLIALAFAVTIGSSMTPMGNPQNLLIALGSGVEAPLFSFLYYLAPPALAGYLATYLILKLYYRRELSNASRPPRLSLEGVITDPQLARVAVAATLLTLAGFIAISVARLLGYAVGVNYGTISLLGAAVVYALSPRSRDIIRNVDWSVILFFIGLFIVTQAAWDSGLIRLISNHLTPLTPGDSPETIIGIVVVSILLSQLMSNVPFTAVYINVMKSLGFGPDDTKAWAALAGASTLAGNLTILGAASTIIILEAAERRGYTFSFLDYLKVGAPVTAATAGILTLWLLVA